MRLEKWFISNLDDSQRKIIVQSIDEDIIVQGAAGSGKTNLAIHRALQAKNKGSYAIVIFTVALKRMIAYGMQALGLDKERIAYEWAWTHRGFDLTGDVFWEKGNRNTLYLVNDLNVRKFERTEKDKTAYGIDFADWVDYKFYSAFGRRVSWFKEVPYLSGFSVTNTNKFELIPSGTIYKQSEDKIDYLIIDEAQDFNISDYQGRIIPHKGKSLSLFGDSVQQMNFKGSSIDEIANTLVYKRLSLDYNYRLPKTIAKVAQQIQDVKVDLLTNNMKDGGNSDYPNYPKPIVTKYSSREKELEGILNRIKMEDLDDVAILVPDESDVPFDIQDKKGTIFKTDPTIEYFIEREDAKVVFLRYRKTTEELEQSVILTEVKNAYKDVAGLYETDSLINNRPAFEKEVEALLKERLSTRGFTFTNIQSSVKPNDVLQAAIDEKNTAVQNALKVENEKKAAIAEAEKVVAAAKGKADANRILQQSITPELIQLKAVEKWDGKLPLSTGGNTLPFLKLQ